MRGTNTGYAYQLIATHNTDINRTTGGNEMAVQSDYGWEKKGIVQTRDKVGVSELDDLLFAGTTAKQENESFTMDKLEEAKAIIEALTPPKAPEGVNSIQGATGLTIMKNNLMPSGTIMVSEDLFDLIYASSK